MASGLASVIAMYLHAAVDGRLDQGCLVGAPGRWSSAARCYPSWPPSRRPWDQIPERVTRYLVGDHRNRGPWRVGAAGRPFRRRCSVAFRPCWSRLPPRSTKTPWPCRETRNFIASPVPDIARQSDPTCVQWSVPGRQLDVTPLTSECQDFVLTLGPAGQSWATLGVVGCSSRGRPFGRTCEIRGTGRRQISGRPGWCRRSSATPATRDCRTRPRGPSRRRPCVPSPAAGTSGSRRAVAPPRGRQPGADALPANRMCTPRARSAW